MDVDVLVKAVAARLRPPPLRRADGDEAELVVHRRELGLDQQESALGFGQPRGEERAHQAQHPVPEESMQPR